MTRYRPLRTAASLLLLTAAGAIVMRFQLSITRDLVADFAPPLPVDSLPVAPADPAAVPFETGVRAPLDVHLPSDTPGGVRP